MDVHLGYYPLPPGAKPAGNMKYLIWIILACSLFLRVYRVGDLTGFYYDQGRDAKVVWELWHSGKLFLIGPTTGIEGIFLGPFYYYLIAPFYLLGTGNPVFPAVALALINCLGIYVIYLIGRHYFDEKTGLLTAFFITFSHQLVQAHRWLSNPTPLPLFAALALLLILKIVRGSKAASDWLGLGLILGLSLQLEAASAVFFLPAAAFIFLLFRIRIPLHFFFTFSLTLIPQLWFNLRHDNLLLDSFRRFLVTDRSFLPAVFDFYPRRLGFYFAEFSAKFFADHTLALVFSVVLLLLTFFFRSKLITRPLTVLLIWVITPLVFLLFYHGNNGYVWGYYFTGVYPAFVLLVSWVLITAYKSGLWPVRALVGIFISVFFVTNLLSLRTDLLDDQTGQNSVALGPSRAAVDWVYTDAGDTEFNVDVYVPPVIAHSYDYLFLWRGTNRFSRMPSRESQKTLYLIYETDASHPERLDAWLLRQSTIAVPELKMKFGGVTAERRIRI